MVTFLLIRHASANIPQDTLVGRQQGFRLTADGFREANELAEQLDGVPIEQIWSGPLSRVVATAAAIATRRRLPIHISEAFDELDYGDWTGQSIHQLRSDPLWLNFNQTRSSTPIPNGETITQVQHRVITAMTAISKANPCGALIVSHADVIRAALTHYLGLSVDIMLRICIDCASYSAVRLFHDGSPQVLFINRAASH
jgi:broad specificity phosphatase PhoE